jgi:hypothetical protein
MFTFSACTLIIIIIILLDHDIITAIFCGDPNVFPDFFALNIEWHKNVTQFMDKYTVST